MPAQETVLLAVTGMSPAILPETIWALATAPKHPVVVDRVVVVTTLRGKEAIGRELLEPHPAFSGLCVWDSLRSSLQTLGCHVQDKLRFGSTGSDLRVFTTTDPATGRNRELDDIRTLADNESAADFLLETLRSFTDNQDCHVIASLAGGRKTMGALLYACMSLVGRETDRLTHVLVPDPYDAPLQPRFYYPAQPCQLLQHGDRSILAADAHIVLAEVPFVPLRNLFHDQLGRLPGNFRTLVENCRKDIRHAFPQHLTLTLYRGRTLAEVNGLLIKTSPREHLLLLFFASQHTQIPPDATYAGIEDLVNAFRLHLIQQASSTHITDWRHHESLRQPIEETKGDHIRKLLGSLRAKFRKAGNEPRLAAALLPGEDRLYIDMTIEWK